ncbi:MAG: cytochrome c [Pirellulaceae bacterium]
MPLHFFRHRGLSIALVALAALVTAPFLGAQQKGKPAKTIKRAQPPKFEKKGDVFYPDAFKDGLVGARPADLGKAAPTVTAATPGGTTTPAAGNTGGLAGSGWSVIISGQTIEDEVKELKKLIDVEVTTPSDYAGKGYKVARRDFSMLAMMFAIAGEYDGEVRWKKESPAARDVFARTAANSKVGTSQVFQEAKLRKAELQDLVGGSSPFQGKEADAKAVWSSVCDRSPLMQHLERIYEPQLKPLLSDKGQFTTNIDKVTHDAEIIAAIGAVLAKDGMEDADADEYKAFCVKLQKAAKDIVEAAKVKNFDAASSAGTAIGKACVECHEGYRSS